MAHFLNFSLKSRKLSALKKFRIVSEIFKNFIKILSLFSNNELD